ncbi:hypothetical protein M514_16705 [Trichuris suis]|uniref:Uncharacterized protein n=1 Tax=Trichuris suis TaxID=68888 RepID=A0A085NNA8_9BILA|nr:hypothetical protein M514_16705 [Trichuris suis]
MVDLDGDVPYGHKISNSVFLIPAVIVASLIGFVVYKLIYILKERKRKVQEKRKNKEKRK